MTGESDPKVFRELSRGLCIDTSGEGGRMSGQGVNSVSG